MKIIAIGDTHGRNYWKQIALKAAFDHLVFIGDYFDAPDFSTSEQIENFRELLAFKKANPAKVTLLTGNHDFHYLPVALQAGEVYTGFQHKNAARISLAIGEGLEHLQMCYQWEDYLFTHAGVTQLWLDNAGYREGPVDVFINTLFREQPQHFFFNGYEPSGDDITQSPIWVRPYSLQQDAYNPAVTRQVVGHTRVNRLTSVQDRFFFIDTMSASREYLVIGDGQVSINRIT